jgi:hypothetical protein
MTWEEKFKEVFPRDDQRSILAGQKGILALHGYKGEDDNLESAVKAGNTAEAEKMIERNCKYFQEYCKAYKLYKLYPGEKEIFHVSNTWASAQIRIHNGKLYFPTAEGMTPEQFMLKASRLFAHWEQRIAKHPRNRKV